MTANAATFEATIKTVDQASGPLRIIASRMNEMTAATAAAEKQIDRLGRQDALQILGNHARLVRDRFESLGSSIGSVHGRLSGLIPALGGLAAIGSFGGLIHLVDTVAQRRSEALERLERLGVDPKRLGQLTMAAKAALVPVDQLDAGLAKLSNTMVEAYQGKNKDAAALFQHLRMSLTENGHLRDAGDVMLQLFDPFRKTEDAVMRQRMARVLMGKGGGGLLQMFRMTREELQKIAEDTRGLTFGPTKEDDANLRNYQRQMGYLQLAVRSYQDSMGAAAAPVLEPFIEGLRKWLVNHRDEITGKFRKDLEGAKQGLEEFAKSFDWGRFEADVKLAWGAVTGVVGALGGLNRVIEIMIAYKAGSWALGFARGVFRLGVEVRAVIAAITGMQAAMVAADSTTVFGGIIVRLGLILARLSEIGVAMAILWPSSTASPEQDEVHPGRSAELSRQIYRQSLRSPWSWDISQPPDALPSGVLPAPSVAFSLPSATPGAGLPNGLPKLGPLFGPQLPQSLLESGVPPLPLGDRSGGDLKISVDFSNVPAGAKVNVDSSGIPNPVQTDVGYNRPIGGF